MRAMLSANVHPTDIGILSAVRRRVALVEVEVR